MADLDPPSRLEQLCIERGMKMTGQRRIIAEVLSSSEDHPDVIFAKVNTEDEQEIAMHFQIRSIPTLMIFREKVIIFSQAGALPESGFRDLVQKASGLDMAEVHRQIAEEPNSA